MGLSLCPSGKDSPSGTRTSQSTDPKFVAMRSTSSTSMSLGVMVSKITVTSTTWVPDPCILFEDKAANGV